MIIFIKTLTKIPNPFMNENFYDNSTIIFLKKIILL